MPPSAPALTHCLLCLHIPRYQILETACPPAADAEGPPALRRASRKKPLTGAAPTPSLRRMHACLETAGDLGSASSTVWRVPCVPMSAVSTTPAGLQEADVRRRSCGAAPPCASSPSPSASS